MPMWRGRRGAVKCLSGAVLHKEQQLRLWIDSGCGLLPRASESSGRYLRALSACFPAVLGIPVQKPDSPPHEKPHPNGNVAPWCSGTRIALRGLPPASIPPGCPRHADPLWPIVQPRTAHMLFIQAEPQRFDQMEPGTRCQSQPSGSSRIMRNFRMKHDDVETGLHVLILITNMPPVQVGLVQKWQIMYVFTR